MRYVTFLAVGLVLAMPRPGAAQDQKAPEPKPVQVPNDQDGFGRFVADQVTAAVPGATVKIEKPLVLTHPHRAGFRRQAATAAGADLGLLPAQRVELRRDIVAYVQGDTKGDATALKQFVQKTRQRQKYPVTAAVLRWTPEGWRVVE